MSKEFTTKAVELALEWCHHWTALGEYKLARACREWAQRIKDDTSN